MVMWAGSTDPHGGTVDESGTQTAEGDGDLGTYSRNNLVLSLCLFKE